MLAVNPMKNVLANFQKIAPAQSEQLDTLRGLSAIAVLIGHSIQIFIAPVIPAISPAFGLLAQAAVMLFFVLSGFLITKSCTRNLSQNDRFDVAAYARDRLNRIYPPLVFALALVMALVLIAPYVFPSGSLAFVHHEPFIARSGFYVDVQSFAGTIVFLNGFFVDNISANGPLWSLSYEVWYYVVAGLIAWRIGIGTLLGLAVLLFLGSINKVFLAYSAVWFGGAAVAIMHNRKSEMGGIAVLTLVAALCGAISMGAYYLSKAIFAQDPSEYPMMVLVLFNLSFGIAAASALHLMMTGKLSFRPIASTSAKYSYTLYVTHFPILLFIYGAAQGLVHGNVWTSAIASACAFLIALGVARKVAPVAENMSPIPRKPKAAAG